MILSAPRITLLTLAGGLFLFQFARALARRPLPLGSYLGFTAAFFAGFVAAEFLGFRAGNWIVAILSFLALREYFSLVDLRLQDRLAVLGAYASIPFMFHFVTIDYYGMFIVSIPVYGFLAVPLLVSLGGREPEGAVLSIGVIDFGLFLFVFCMGHISYLMAYSVWMAAMLMVNVTACDVIIWMLRRSDRREWVRVAQDALAPMPVTILLNVLLSEWTGIPPVHAVTLGVLIPVLVLMGRHTGKVIQVDLGVRDEALWPGRGQILDNLKSLLFAAPAVFHYIRYFLR